MPDFANRRPLLRSGILAGTLLLAGCSSEPVETRYDKEQEFLRLARSVTSLEAVDDATLIDAGWGLCDDFDRGYSASYLIDEAQIVFTTSDGMRGFASVLSAAVTVLCPEHYDKAKDDLG